MAAADDKTTAQALALGIAAMHDRAARRSREPQARLIHEQCAMHLRALADDPDALSNIVAADGRTEATNEDF